ncbi:hypothetical protein BU23DRAFT_548391 [Bimuria novae-zelandiae CBS 107.79]|uniref:Uncharacterized protein n=1 Tax=Bimuria novae-zelandiae CBS 107.79 TaxID=1447943 RepID=A0A6A5VS76_9PLEO|nr:hypothetical protein BU23DRAFT_548391 [Bimuria novae-zelandiae CBS 107.79]
MAGVPLRALVRGFEPRLLLIAGYFGGILVICQSWKPTNSLGMLLFRIAAVKLSRTKL